MKRIIDIPDWMYREIKSFSSHKVLEQIVLESTPLNECEADDCISKAATCNAIIKRLGIKDESYLLESERVIYQQILAMPPVNPKSDKPCGKWIPVTERLPEPLTFVNATCRSLIDDRDDWVVETIYVPIPKEHNPRGYSDWGNIPMLNWKQAEVIAWMKRIIPEPYVAEEQGGHK